METRRTPVSVWMTSLTWTALPLLLRSFFRHGRFSLRFTKASRGGQILAWLLRVTRVLDSEAQQVENTAEGQRLDDSQSGCYRIWVLLEEFTARFFATHRAVLLKLAYPDSRVQPHRVSGNLRKLTLVTTYQLLDFVELARYWERINGNSPRRLVILSPYAVLANQVSPGWAGRDVEFGCPWSWQHSLLLWLGRGILQCLTDAVRKRCPQPVGPASIGVGFVWGLEQSSRLNDLLWWWESGIPAERVVLFFDRSSHPASREVVAYAERLGLRCVVLDRQAAGDSPHLLWRAAPGLGVSLGRLWQKLRVFGWGLCSEVVGRWVACRMLQMLYWTHLREDFLREFNVMGLFHIQDTDLDYLSLACDAAGAARIGCQWSNLSWPMVDQMRLHQVYFPWGPLSATVHAVIGSNVDHMLLSGCIIRGAYPGSDSDLQGKDYRTKLAAHGASRIIALLDSSLPGGGFYEFFLRRVIQNRRWGLLIKPKAEEDLPWVRQRASDLQVLYEEALATGRVLMLDSSVSPVEAAAGADFVVALSSVGLNTAGVVAALAGHRTVQLDYLGFQASHWADWAHFHKAGADRLVFNGPEKLWRKLNRYFDEPGSEPDLGAVDDFLLWQIDPFRDGLAEERIGEYVRWYLEGLDEGLGRDRALGEATRRYADKWGVDKVFRGLSGVAASVGMSNDPSCAAVVSSRMDASS